MGAEKSHAEEALQLKNILAQLYRDELPIEQVVSLLRSDSSLVRANACLSVSRQAAHQDNLIGNLIEAVDDPRNSEHIMGWRISDLAVAALLSVRTANADTSALQIIKHWPQNNRYDVLSWVKRLDLMEPHDLASYESRRKVR